MQSSEQQKQVFIKLAINEHSSANLRKNVWTKQHSKYQTLDKMFRHVEHLHNVIVKFHNNDNDDKC